LVAALLLLFAHADRESTCRTSLPCQRDAGDDVAYVLGEPDDGVGALAQPGLVRDAAFRDVLEVFAADADADD
jgi:hypothetical protein